MEEEIVDHDKEDEKDGLCHKEDQKDWSSGSDLKSCALHFESNATIESTLWREKSGASRSLSTRSTQQSCWKIAPRASCQCDAILASWHC